MTKSDGARVTSSVGLVRDAVVLWPRSTGVAFGILCVIGAIDAHEDYAPCGFGMLLAGLAWLLGLVAYKAIMVFMLYPVLFRAPFRGSFVRVAFVVMVLLFSVVGIFALLGVEISTLPLHFLLPFVAFSYVVSSLMLGVFLRVNYQMHRDRWVPWRRLDEESPTPPTQPAP